MRLFDLFHDYLVHKAGTAASSSSSSSSVAHVMDGLQGEAEDAQAEQTGKRVTTYVGKKDEVNIQLQIYLRM